MDPSSGDVYVVDYGNERIQKFTASGTFILMFGGGVDATTGADVCTASSGDRCQPGTTGSGDGRFGGLIAGAAVDPGNGDVYVADAQNDRVEVFDSSGNYLSQFGTSGSGNGQLMGPYDLAFNPTTDDVYVADQSNFRIEEFSASGTYIGQFGSAGSGNGQFNSNGPAGVAVDPATGNVYVADLSGNRIEEFNSAGSYLAQVGTSGSGALSQPIGVAVDPSNSDVYVGELGIARVVTFDSTGTYLSDADAPGATLVGLSAAAGSTVYAVDQANNQIDILAPGIPAAPVVEDNSTPCSSVTSDSATLNAVVNPTGDDTAYYFQFVPNAAYDPAAADPYGAGTATPAPPGTNIGALFGAVAVSVNLTGLSATTLYDYRVVAENALGTTDGPNATCSTATPLAPSIDSQVYASITGDAASLNAELNPNYAATTYYFEYVDAAGYDPTATDPYSSGGQLPLAPGTSIGSGGSDQAAAVTLRGLQATTVYHWRVVAVNALGTTDGADQTFSTQTPAAPSIDAESVSAVGPNTATLNDEINPNYDDTSAYFQYVDAAGYNPAAPDPYSSGVEIPLPPGNEIGDSNVDQGMAVTVAGLIPGATYYYHVVAANGVNTTSGPAETFTTPYVETGSAESVTASSAVIFGALNPDGTDTLYYFDYGTDTSYGARAPLSYSDAGSGTSNIEVSQMLTGLRPNTTYHFRLASSTDGGTTYVHGEDESFTTLPSAPAVAGASATGFGSTGVLLSGSVDPQGAPTTYHFDYGPTAAYGASTVAGSAGSGAAPAAVSELLAGLAPASTYHFRLVAANAGGTSDGADETFTTASGASGVSPTPASAAPTTTPPTPTAASKASQLGRLTVGKSADVMAGVAAVKITCRGAAAASCTGSMKLTIKEKVTVRTGGKSRASTTTITVGRADFRLSAGASRILRVTLTRAMARSLSVGDREIRVIVTVRQAEGTTTNQGMALSERSLG